MQSARTFRIFVSSTFSDLKAERNALQKNVFPKLRKLCEKHGCRFQAIDLRWGVSEEAALDQQAMRICLEEVERCQKLSPRPNFIVLLGDRYGWQPLPYEIPATEYETITVRITTEQKEHLARWYKHDANAVPPVYCLLPREGEYEKFDVWNPIEKELLAILRSGVQKAGLSDSVSVKYFSSATEQEIVRGVLSEPDSKQHVFCFLRGIDNLPEGPEVNDFLDLNADSAKETNASKKLVALKNQLRQLLPGNVHDYGVKWKEDGITTDHLEQLCKDVYDELSNIILEEISHLEKIDTLNKEIADHETFARERIQHFTGRAAALELIATYAKGDSQNPFAVYGCSGSGKSALMGYEAAQLRNELPEAFIITRYIGVTPSSSDIRSLLESLCRQISRLYGADETNIPAEYKDLIDELPKCLALATVDKPLVIFLDALDQFSDTDNAKSLNWLPTALPVNVHIVVSALQESEYFQTLTRSLPRENHYVLPPMTIDEGKILLDLWLCNAGRTLQQFQRREIWEKFNQCGLPLYLKLALEEAKLWKSYDKAVPLNSDIPGIINDLFSRLSADNNHGSMMVSRSLGYIAAAKNGLTEDELIDVLSLDKEVMKDFVNRSTKSPEIDRLPVVVWSRLNLDLMPYLTEKYADGTLLMTFFHKQFGEVIKNEYIDDETNKKLHRLLAEYFGSQPYQYEIDGKKVPHYRKASELAYQMMQGEMWDELENTLTDFDFPMAKTMGGMVEELVADYQKAITFPVPNKETMRIWAAFFREGVHILRRGNNEWPAYKILLQLAVEHADNSPITQQAEEWLKTTKHKWLWLMKKQRLSEVAISPCFIVFEGHSFPIAGAIELSNGTIFSWQKWNGTVRIWDKESGECLKVFDRHSGVTNGLIELSNGRILSWSMNTLMIWDKESGECLKKLQGHRESIRGAIELRDGRILSWSGDTTLMIWDKESGEYLKILKGHSGWIRGAIELRDGRILSWSGDTTLMIWDKESGECLKILEGHSDRVSGVIELINGKILSWSWDSTLRIWDKESGECLNILEGHRESIRGAIELSDVKILSWSTDGTLRIWDKESGECLKILEEHSGLIDGAIELSDGKILSWSTDGTVRIWDKESGECLNILEGHSDRVSGVIELINGKILSWSDDSTLRIWDKGSRERLKRLEGHRESIRGTIELSSGKILSRDSSTLRIWDKGSGECLKKLHGHRESIRGAIELRDDKILSWGSSTLRIWDEESGECLKILEGHSDSIYKVIELINGKILSWSWDSTLRIWDKESGECLKILEGHSDRVSGVIELINGKMLSWSKDNSLRIWDKESGECLKILEVPFGDRQPGSVLGAIELIDGNILSWSKASEYRTLMIWDKETGECIKILKQRRSQKSLNGDICPSWKVLIRGAIELRDGKILSWSTDGTLRIWDKESGECLNILEGHGNWVLGAIELSDGKILSWSWDSTLRIWNKESGECLKILEGHSGRIRGAIEVGDGKVLSWSKSKTLIIWDNEMQIPHQYLWQAAAQITSVLFTKVGIIVAGLASGQMCFLDLYDGNKKISLKEQN